MYNVIFLVSLSPLEVCTVVPAVPVITVWSKKLFSKVTWNLAKQLWFLDRHSSLTIKILY